MIAPMAVAGTLGGSTFGLARPGADMIAGAAVGHGMEYAVSHSALDATGAALEHSHDEHSKKKADEKLNIQYQNFQQQFLQEQAKLQGPHSQSNERTRLHVPPHAVLHSRPGTPQSAKPQPQLSHLNPGLQTVPPIPQHSRPGTPEPGQIPQYHPQFQIQAQKYGCAPVAMTQNSPISYQPPVHQQQVVQPSQGGQPEGTPTPRYQPLQQPEQDLVKVSSPANVIAPSYSSEKPTMYTTHALPNEANRLSSCPSPLPQYSSKESAPISAKYVEWLLQSMLFLVYVFILSLIFQQSRNNLVSAPSTSQCASNTHKPTASTTHSRRRDTVPQSKIDSTGIREAGSFSSANEFRRSKSSSSIYNPSLERCYWHTRSSACIDINTSLRQPVAVVNQSQSSISPQQYYPFPTTSPVLTPRSPNIAGGKLPPPPPPSWPPLQNTLPPPPPARNYTYSPQDYPLPPTSPLAQQQPHFQRHDSGYYSSGATPSLSSRLSQSSSRTLSSYSSPSQSTRVSQYIQNPSITSYQPSPTSLAPPPNLPPSRLPMGPRKDYFNQGLPPPLPRPGGGPGYQENGAHGIQGWQWGMSAPVGVQTQFPPRPPSPSRG